MRKNGKSRSVSNGAAHARIPSQIWPIGGPGSSGPLVMSIGRREGSCGLSRVAWRTQDAKDPRLMGEDVDFFPASQIQLRAGRKKVEAGLGQMRAAFACQHRIQDRLQG